MGFAKKAYGKYKTYKAGDLDRLDKRIALEKRRAELARLRRKKAGPVRKGKARSPFGIEVDF